MVNLGFAIRLPDRDIVILIPFMSFKIVPKNRFARSVPIEKHFCVILHPVINPRQANLITIALNNFHRHPVLSEDSTFVSCVHSSLAQIY